MSGIVESAAPDQTDAAHEAHAFAVPPAVAIASLGGTITMVADETGTGVRPALDAAALVASVPGLADAARLVTETLATKPGASLEVGELLAALEWAEARIADGAAGVVLVQGTDTIEETAYLLELHWRRPEPLVVTGAMRPPQAAGADGPANLLAAVQVAGAPESRDRGVLVVMNDEVHAAARVRKTRSSGVGAFASLDFGPLGHVEEGRVVYGSPAAPHAALPLPAARSHPPVALIETHLGDDGRLLELVHDAGYAGAVLGGFGVGHVSAGLARAVRELAPGFPLVLATRTGGGTTFRGTYGFRGSERDLLDAGVIGAGWLDPRKARMLLATLLADGASPARIHAEFAERGGRPAPATGSE